MTIPAECSQRRAGGSPYCLPPVGGPVHPDKSPVHCFQRRAGGSPCCLPPVGGPERPEKSPVDCFQRRAGGSPGRWPRRGRMRSSPRPAFAACPPASLPRTGARNTGNHSVRLVRPRPAQPAYLRSSLSTLHSSLSTLHSPLSTLSSGISSVRRGICRLKAFPPSAHG